MKRAQHVIVNKRWHGTHQNGKANIFSSAPWPELFWDAFGLDPGRIHRKWLEMIRRWTWGQMWRKEKKEDANGQWYMGVGLVLLVLFGNEEETNAGHAQGGTRCFRVKDNRATQCLTSKMLQKVSFYPVFLCHSVLTNPLQLKYRDCGGEMTFPISPLQPSLLFPWLILAAFPLYGNMQFMESVSAPTPIIHQDDGHLFMPMHWAPIVYFDWSPGTQVSQN